MSEMEKIINSKNFGSIIKDVIFKRRQWPSKNKTENDNALTMRNWLKIPSHILYINMHTITLINLPSYWEMYFSFTSYIYVYSSMGFYIMRVSEKYISQYEDIESRIIVYGLDYSIWVLIISKLRQVRALQGSVSLIVYHCLLLKSTSLVMLFHYLGVATF